MPVLKPRVEEAAAGAVRRKAQPEGAARILPFRRRLIWSARCATCRNLAEVWSYINPAMLYGRHLGYKGNFEKDLAAHEPKALELFHQMEELKQEAARFMKVQGGLAVLRSRAGRQRDSPVRAGRRGAAFTRSASAGSIATMGCV